MMVKKSFLLISFISCLGCLFSQSNAVKPKIGYLYPAGAQKGKTTRVIIGGQFLRGATDVLITGEGVHAKILSYYNPGRNLNREQRILLNRRLAKVYDQRLAELPEELRCKIIIKKNRKRKLFNKNRFPEIYKKIMALPKVERKAAFAIEEEKLLKEDDVNISKEKLRGHPYLDNLEEKSFRELSHLNLVYFNWKWKRQYNRQLAEYLVLEVTVDKNAKLDAREIRIKSQRGFTNPMVFKISDLNEVLEIEPNDNSAHQAFREVKNLPKKYLDQTVKLPVILNGQIMPGDVDRFAFEAKKGQKLVVSVNARELIPYLADAVPGWFQAVVNIYDSKGKEVAYADDYRFNPDPVLLFEVPADGKYEIAIRDSIYRGREDFVYRICISEGPFINSLFPLGGRFGAENNVRITGWNLTTGSLKLNSTKSNHFLRKTPCEISGKMVNSLPYRVDDFPEVIENNHHHKISLAQKVNLPIIINGKISKPGEVDIFKINIKKGESVVAEVYARRLNSPVDSLILITDARGKVLKMNDDYIVKDKHLHKDSIGTVTHHSDSYLNYTFLNSGEYFIHLRDSQNKGGDEYSYRLRLSNPIPDFELRVTPSSIVGRTGDVVPVTVYALRKDGFQGAIKLNTITPGFKINGSVIPSGCEKIKMTIMFPYEGTTKPVKLQLVGSASIGDRKIKRNVVPADNTMQAFLYRHLLPAKEFLAFVKWRKPPVKIITNLPVVLNVNVNTKIRVQAFEPEWLLKQFKLKLVDPPEGISLNGIKVVKNGIDFDLLVDKEKFKEIFSTNLLVEIIRHQSRKDKKGKKLKDRVYRVGYLPVISVVVK